MNNEPVLKTSREHGKAGSSWLLMTLIITIFVGGLIIIMVTNVSPSQSQITGDLPQNGPGTAQPTTFTPTSPTPSQPPTPTAPVTPPPTAQNSGWQEFNAPNGSFKILFPTLPTHTQKYSGTDSFPFYGEMYRTEGDNLQYFVEYVDYSKMDTSDPDSFLNMSMNGLASQPGSYVIDSRFDYWGNRRTLDFEIGTKIGHILGRAIMDGSMMYLMGAMGNTPNLPQSDYDKFIYSFSIK